MKHNYTDEQLQAAIDGACLEIRREHRGKVGTSLVIDTDDMPTAYKAESSARLDLIKSALAALPEPPTVDGKTPGQVAWDAGNEVQKRKFPNEPVMSWQEGDELHEQIGVAAAAVRAAFGNQSHADEPTPEPMSTKPISLPLAECLSLRDWFAGMALQGKATRLNNPHEHRDILSSDCYDVADAMLKAREVKP